MGRGDGVAQGYYEPFMTGNRRANNSIINQEIMIERMYVRVLSELCMNRFKWEGLPDTVDPRYLELTLMRYALAVFYNDPAYGYMAMQATVSGIINHLNNPTGFTAVGTNFAPRQLKAAGPMVKNVSPTANIGVPIWSNYWRMPDYDIIYLYAKRLANLERTVEINSINARLSKVVVGNNNQRLTLRNINRMVDEGQNYIEINSEAIDLDTQVQAFDLGINPDSIEKIDIVRDRQWNKCMTLLGINNANQDKKERLVTAEVGANDDTVTSMRFVNLNARQQACEEINRVFGLNVSVSYHTDMDNLIEEGLEEGDDETSTDSPTTADA